eukprot:3232209-Pleurochrysis_carterae.AAC.1
MGRETPRTSTAGMWRSPIAVHCLGNLSTPMTYSCAAAVDHEGEPVADAAPLLEPVVPACQQGSGGGRRRRASGDGAPPTRPSTRERVAPSERGVKAVPDGAEPDARGAAGARKDGAPQAQRQGRWNEAHRAVNCARARDQAREDSAGAVGQVRRGHACNTQKAAGRARQRRDGGASASSEAREARLPHPSAGTEDEHHGSRGALRQAEGADRRRGQRESERRARKQ